MTPQEHKNYLGDSVALFGTGWRKLDSVDLGDEVSSARWSR